MKSLTPKHHVCTWVNGAGRTRGLYAEQRGQFVQGMVSGFGYRTRFVLAADWCGLGLEMQRIALQWSPTWRLKGQGIAGRNPRRLIEARA